MKKTIIGEALPNLPWEDENGKPNPICYEYGSCLVKICGVVR